MSGGGGGGRPGGDGGPTPCEQIEFDTALQSPDPDVLQGLEEGAILRLALQGRVVVAMTPDGRTAGSIIQSVEDLIRCIGAGNEYQARVLSIEDGLVRLHVEHVN